MTQPVSARYLLEGAAYALEQCGLLLRDANILCRSQSYASAVVMAAFAREELGRWKVLLDLRREVVGGKQVTLDDVDARCGDHMTKQKAGMVSIAIRAPNDSGQSELLRALANTEHGSSEWKALYEKAGRMWQQVRKRTPGERHERRMSALYVDPTSATQWNRPSHTITQETARDFLIDAVNDYSL